MPKYSAKRVKKRARARKKATRGFTRDKRILKRWAVAGTHKDYAKLRRHAERQSDSAPSYVLPSTMEDLRSVDRRRMIELIHDEPHGGGMFMDGLNWLLDQAPSGSWGWLSGLARAASKPWQGDSLTETDSEYAKLIDATYKEDRPELVENWRRLAWADGKYCSAWESADGHVVIAVRGTKPTHWEDLAQDMRILGVGSPTDAVSQEFRRIMNSVGPDKTVDVASHSLGTSLTLVAYDQNPELYSRVHQTYLYNPAASPVNWGANITEKFEQDPRVRFFISLSDPVSVGSLGNEPPANVVFRTGNILHPLAEHDVGSWYPGTYEELNTTQENPAAIEQREDAMATRVRGEAVSAPQPDGRPSGLDFGSDEFAAILDRQIAGVPLDLVYKQLGLVPGYGYR